MSKARTTLKTISTRRNQIVHEADINMATGKKYSIEKDETVNVANFILSCGNSIYNSVRQPVGDGLGKAVPLLKGSI